MKSVFSCSDFLSDLWQGGPDGGEPLDGLACPASEGGSTQLGREGSTDLLNLLNQTEEAESNSRTLANLAASSSNKQESSGTSPWHAKGLPFSSFQGTLLCYCWFSVSAAAPPSEAHPHLSWTRELPISTGTSG